MKYLSWLLKAAVFFTIFAFAINNQGDVRVHFFFGAYWDAPMVLVVLAVLTLGIAVGIAVMLPLWLRARKAAQAGAAGTAAQASSTDNDSLPPHGI